MRLVAALLVLWFALTRVTLGQDSTRADPQISRQPSLPEITRGQQVVIHGKNFAPGVYTVRLSTGDSSSNNAIVLPATPSADKLSLTFTPTADKVPVNRYLVSVNVGGKEYPVPGDLRLLADEQAPVTIDTIRPSVVYPGDESGVTFDISGKNLGYVAANNLLAVNRSFIATGSLAQCATPLTDSTHRPCLVVEPGMETRTLQVRGYKRGDYDGPVKLRVQVGANTSNEVPVTFSRYSEGTVRVSALAAFVLVALIVWALVWRAGRAVIDGEKFNAWQAILLDRETETYSLSKFQLLAWSAVFVFGYLYLFLCRLLIQWKFEMPPVPEGMPALLAISAGTAVAAAGATAARGSKGAGGVHPSVADFISSGGIVTGERFQFFVWTIVGTFGFLSTLVLADPARLLELPKIPDSLLYLMGISSVGYLAGKVVRKPGPNIKSLVISSLTFGVGAAGRTRMVLKLVGEHLSEKATIKVDDKELRITDEYRLDPTKREDQAADPTFCTELLLTLLDAAAYVEGPHTVTLINGDAQMASAVFPVDAMEIETLTFDPARTVITVKGKNFDEGLAAEWQPSPAGAAVAATSVAWNKDKPDELIVTLAAPASATGALVLRSQLGLRASRKTE